MAAKRIQRGLTLSALCTPPSDWPAQTKHVGEVRCPVRRIHLPPTQVILDAEIWVQNLPKTIEAVFVIDGTGDEFAARAHAVHREFIEKFGTHVPLLLFTANNDPPFSEITVDSNI